MQNIGKTFLTSALLAVMLAKPVSAQYLVPAASAISLEGREQNLLPRVSWVFSNDDLVERLLSIGQRCQKGNPYQIDCIAERLEALEQDCINFPEASKLRPVLKATAKELHYIARSNRDPLQPRVKLNTASEKASYRPLVAIAPVRQEVAAEQAAMVLSKAETLLMEQMDSTKVVTRQISAALSAQKSQL